MQRRILLALAFLLCAYTCTGTDLLVVPTECEAPEGVEFSYWINGQPSAVAEYLQFVDAEDCIVQPPAVAGQPLGQVLVHRCLADDGELTPLTDWLAPMLLDYETAPRAELCAVVHR